MSKHTEHLPRRDLNKGVPSKGSNQRSLKELAARQGLGTKADAKNAKARTWKPER